MEINTIETFLSYYERTRETTNRFIAVIPRNKMDWSYAPNKFTIADLLRHIAAIERNLFAEVVIGKPISYDGCGKDLGDGYDNVIAYFNDMHQQSMKIFQTLNNKDLTREITSIGGKKLKISDFLRALFIHEIHHRGALCIYLNLLGVQTPSVFGFNEEQIRLKSKAI